MLPKQYTVYVMTLNSILDIIKHVLCYGCCSQEGDVMLCGSSTLVTSRQAATFADLPHMAHV